MHKRYQFQYGNLYVYDVISETEKMALVRRESWNGRKDERRMSKAGTFLSLREAIEDRRDKLVRAVDSAATELDRKRKALAQAREWANLTDEQMVKRVKGEMARDIVGDLGQPTTASETTET